jgi:hypothetical protein
MKLFQKTETTSPSPQSSKTPWKKPVASPTPEKVSIFKKDVGLDSSTNQNSLTSKENSVSEKLLEKETVVETKPTPSWKKPTTELSKKDVEEKPVKTPWKKPVKVEEKTETTPVATKTPWKKPVKTEEKIEVLPVKEEVKIVPVKEEAKTETIAPLSNKLKMFENKTTTTSIPSWKKKETNSPVDDKIQVRKNSTEISKINSESTIVEEKKEKQELTEQEEMNLLESVVVKNLDTNEVTNLKSIETSLNESIDAEKPVYTLKKESTTSNTTPSWKKDIPKKTFPIEKLEPTTTVSQEKDSNEIENVTKVKSSEPKEVEKKIVENSTTLPPWKKPVKVEENKTPTTPTTTTPAWKKKEINPDVSAKQGPTLVEKEIVSEKKSEEKPTEVEVKPTKPVWKKPITPEKVETPIVEVKPTKPTWKKPTVAEKVEEKKVPITEEVKKVEEKVEIKETKEIEVKPTKPTWKKPNPVEKTEELKVDVKPTKPAWKKPSPVEEKKPEVKEVKKTWKKPELVAEIKVEESISLEIPKSVVGEATVVGETPKETNIAVMETKQVEDEPLESIIVIVKDESSDIKPKKSAMKKTETVHETHVKIEEPIAKEIVSFNETKIEEKPTEIEVKPTKPVWKKPITPEKIETPIDEVKPSKPTWKKPVVEVKPTITGKMEEKKVEIKEETKPDIKPTEVKTTKPAWKKPTVESTVKVDSPTPQDSPSVTPKSTDFKSKYSMFSQTPTNTPPTKPIASTKTPWKKPEKTEVAPEPAKTLPTKTSWKKPEKVEDPKSDSLSLKKDINLEIETDPVVETKTSPKVSQLSNKLQMFQNLNPSNPSKPTFKKEAPKEEIKIEKEIVTQPKVEEVVKDQKLNRGKSLFGGSSPWKKPSPSTSEPKKEEPKDEKPKKSLFNRSSFRKQNDEPIKKPEEPIKKQTSFKKQEETLENVNVLLNPQSEKPKSKVSQLGGSMNLPFGKPPPKSVKFSSSDSSSPSNSDVGQSIEQESAQFHERKEHGKLESEGARRPKRKTRRPTTRFVTEDIEKAEMEREEMFAFE